MLWNGVSRMPRLSAAKCMYRSSSGSTAAAASPPFRGGVGRNQYSARQPSRFTIQGRPSSAITASTPAAKRSASGMVRRKLASVSTCSSVARMAAVASALAASVPPIPPVSAVSGRLRARTRWATAALNP